MPSYEYVYPAVLDWIYLYVYGPFSTPWQLFSLPVCCVVGNVLQSVLHPLLWCSASHLSPSNLHSWFFHFHLSPLLPYPLFPSHSVFLASCFPFLSSLMCLSSPLLPPPTVFFFFSSHLHITELLLFSAASCAVGFSPILPPVFSVFPPCLSLRHCYYLFCPVCLIILFPPLYSSTFSWPDRFSYPYIFPFNVSSVSLWLQSLRCLTSLYFLSFLSSPLTCPPLASPMPYAMHMPYRCQSHPLSRSLLSSLFLSSPLPLSSLSAVFVAFRSVHI